MVQSKTFINKENVMEKLKDKKVWGPLVGVVALVAGWYTGVGIPEETQAQAVEGVTQTISMAEGLYAAGAAILAGAAGWFGLKK
jgi:hypothetical protein